MKSLPCEIKKILIISLSNIGDIILTFPVMDVLKNHFPAAKVSVMVGPKGESLFVGNPHFKKVYIFQKKTSVREKLSLIFDLRREGFDLVVDLRHTAIPVLMGARYRTAIWLNIDRRRHKRFQHLDRLNSVVPFTEYPRQQFCFKGEPTDEKSVQGFLKDSEQRLVVVSPGAAAEYKRWPEASFVEVCDRLVEQTGVKIVFVGDHNDVPVAERVSRGMKRPSLDLSGKTTLPQLAAILRRASLVLANDSGVMHMASYLNIPTLALFGPTDPNQYGPWSDRAVVVRNNSSCPACQIPKRELKHDCMRSILPAEVLEKISPLLKDILF